MKVIRRLAAAAAVGALTIGLAPPAFSAPDDPVAIPDTGLQACIANALEIPRAATYTEAQLELLQELDCSSHSIWDGINSLTGLEHASNLTELTVDGPELNAVTPIAGLPLVSLELHGGNDLDLAPLANKDSLLTLRVSSMSGRATIPSLPKLTELTLVHLPPSAVSSASLPKLEKLTGQTDYLVVGADLAQLPSLPELTELTFPYSDVTAIPTLNLPKLTTLDLSSNQISDISGLSSLPELTKVNLRGNSLESVPNSLTVTKLEDADLSNNQISNISTLPAMPNLERLDLRRNQIAELPALNLPNLDWLGLGGNRITNISQTTNLPELDSMSLAGNDLTDISALKSYPALAQLFVNGNKLADLSNLGTSYRFKGQLHATRQRLDDRPTVRACTLAAMPTVKGAPDSRHPIVWELENGVTRIGSNLIYPDTGTDRTYSNYYSQLGRFTQSDSRDDTYFSGRYRQIVQPATSVLAPAPALSAPARYGTRLSVNGVVKCPAATAVAYQWLRNGAAIAGATGATYVPTKADLGTRLSVRVTATKSGLATQVRTSAQSVVAKGVLGAKTPAISGTAKKGKTLKVKMSAWSPAPVKISYQWLRNGSSIKKATKSSYKLTKKDKGKYISVRATGTKTYYVSASRTSARTAKVK